MMTEPASKSGMTGNDGLVAALTAAIYAAFLGTAFMTDGPAVSRVADAATAGAAADALSSSSMGVGIAGASQLSPGGGAGIEAPSQTLEFVVKFDDVEGRRLRDLYIDSPEQARGAFRQLAQEHEGYSDLRLQYMTPSGYGTLAFVGDAPTDANEREALADDILVRLNAAPGVEYAEPNLIAVRGGATQ